VVVVVAETAEIAVDVAIPTAKKDSKFDLGRGCEFAPLFFRIQNAKLTATPKISFTPIFRPLRAWP
jgi:hypothetical protein